MTNENPKLCKKCGGKCCQHFPGRLLPADLGEVTSVNLTKLLVTGNYCVERVSYYGEHFCGQSSASLVLRPKMVIELDHYDVYASEVAPGKCIFWSWSGCSLSFGARPWQCRSLVPGQDQCYVDREVLKLTKGESRSYAAAMWFPLKPLISLVLLDRLEQREKQAINLAVQDIDMERSYFNALLA